MAYYTKIEALGPTWELEDVCWWNRHDLMNDPRFTAIERDGCLDYEATLTKAEVRALHRRYRPLVDAEPIVPDWQRMAKELDRVLAARSKFDSFHVRVLEWSSGM